MDIGDEASWRSTAIELLKFADGLRSGKILGDSSWGEMATITKSADGQIDGAPGLYPGVTGTVDYLCHNGSYTNLSWSGLVMFDDKNATDMVFLSNTDIKQDPARFLPQQIYPGLAGTVGAAEPYIDLFSDNNRAGDETRLLGSLGGKSVPLIDQAYETTSSYDYYLPTGWSARLKYNQPPSWQGLFPGITQTIVGDGQVHSVSLSDISWLNYTGLFGLWNDTLASIQFVPPPSLPSSFRPGPVEDILRIGSDGAARGSLIPPAVDAALPDLVPVMAIPGKHPTRRPGVLSS